jgi:hypothetical protein
MYLMTTALAMEYIPKRMCELGYGDAYTLRMRHMVLQPCEVRKISIYNQLCILTEPYCELRVESMTGIFDLTEDLANELQYEHRGDITITNYSIFINHLRFIQVIPKFCKPLCP